MKRAGMLVGAVFAGVSTMTVGASPERLTVYQNDLALVQEERAIEPDAHGWVDLDEVSRFAVVDSLRLTPQRGAVVQQVFRNDPPTLAALIERNLGARVTLTRTNPGNGEEESRQPTLLSLDDGRVLIDDDGRIESIPMADPAWRFRFPVLPEAMTVKPTLRARLDSLSVQAASLSYLTTGLGWRAHYRLLLDPARGNRQDGALEGRVAVYNDTGTDWAEAILELVAGDPRRVSTSSAKMMRQERMMVAGAAADVMRAAPMAPQREAFGDYHLYRVPGTVAVPTGETRDFRLLARDGLPVRRDYRFDYGTNRGLYQPVEAGDFEAATIRLSFLNDGIEPLPAGDWRVFGADADGVERLLGEDRVDAVPGGREARLEIGQAFDVTARRVQTRFERLNNRETESEWRVELANAGDRAVEVEVLDRFGLNWEITRESDRHDSPDAQSALWRLSVPAGGTRELSYRVHTRQR